MAGLPPALSPSAATEVDAPPPPLPGLGAALRQGVVDFYYNSWRLAPANMVWGAMLIAVAMAAAVWLPLVVLAALLSIPVAGLHRMAALIVRGESVAFADFLDGMRRFAGPALATGFASLGLAGVFTMNVIVGLEMGGIVGWTLSALALYGDIGLAMLLVTWWPLLADPRRQASPLRARLKLAALVVLARPGRMFVLTAVIAGVLLVGTILVALVIMVAVAYVSLVASRYVLPVADRLEAHLASRRPA